MKSPSITSLLLTAALATAAAVPAMAVDLLPPPELPAVGCLYARLDGGGAFRNRPTVFRNLPPDYDLERGFGSGTGEALNEMLDDTGFIEGGLGARSTTCCASMRRAAIASARRWLTATTR